MVYYGKSEGALYEAHRANAELEDKVRFYHNEEESCAKSMNQPFGTLVFYRTFETLENVFTGAADKDEISKWYKPLTVPMLFKFTEDEIEAVFGQQQDAVILFHEQADDDAAFKAVYEEAAKTHKGKMLFAFSDKSNDIQGKLAEFMGVTDDDLPTLRCIIPEKMTKFAAPMAPKDFTVESIGAWIDDIKSGAVKPHLKSDPVPEDNTGPVTTIVGTEFDKIVMDPTKDVLVKYYAPWCGHCKKLLPIWEELGTAFADNKDLVIAKFDATTNEAEGVNIRGYPTLIWYPKDNKAGVNYEGERDLEGLTAYLNEQVKAPAAEATKEDL